MIRSVCLFVSSSFEFVCLFLQVLNFVVPQSVVRNHTNNFMLSTDHALIPQNNCLGFGTLRVFTLTLFIFAGFRIRKNRFSVKFLRCSLSRVQLEAENFSM